MSDYSDVRVYIRPIGQDVDSAQIEDFLKGYGKIMEVKLMQGFGFIEFENPGDAKDAIADLNGKEFDGNPLQIEFARARRRRDDEPPTERRVRRTGYRAAVTGLSPDVSWQDLKDFAREAGVEVSFTDIPRSRDGTGVIEFESESDLRVALDKLDGREIKGEPVRLQEDNGPPPRQRSRSPYRRRGGGDRYGGGGRDRDSRGPPRDYRDRYDRDDRDRDYGGRGGGGGYGRDRDRGYDRDRGGYGRERGGGGYDRERGGGDRSGGRDYSRRYSDRRDERPARDDAPRDAPREAPRDEWDDYRTREWDDAA